MASHQPTAVPGGAVASDQLNALLDAARADETLARALLTATGKAERRARRVQALIRAVVARAALAQSPLDAETHAAQGRFECAPVDELVGFLRLHDAARNEVVRQAAVAQAEHRARADEKLAQVAGLKLGIRRAEGPGKFFGSPATTNPQAEAGLRGLRQESQFALDAWRTAEKEMARAQARRAKPDIDAALLLERQHPGLIARTRPLLGDARLMAQARRRMAEQDEASATIEEIMAAFSSHAKARASNAPGYADGGLEWEALPPPLRQRIESFLQLSGDARQSALERMRHDLRRGSRRARTPRPAVYPR